MTLRKYSSVIFLALAAASALSAAEITGKVRDASGDAATVVVDGDALPAVGDSVEIYFKVPGADEEISVASGKVAAVDAKVVNIKIEKSTGTIAKDQLARIKSGSTPQTLAASPSPVASPSTQATKSSPISGDWVGARAQDKLSCSFKDDGTFLLIAEAKDRGVTLRGKYRVDPTSQPNRVDLFEINPPTESGDAMSGIFELQADGSLKLDLSDEYRKKSGQGFTSSAIVFSKATSAIVAPPEKKAADTGPKPIAPDASASGTATPGTSIIGDWVGAAPDGTVSFSFKEDGSMLWEVEGEKYAQAAHAKYRNDLSKQPHTIELFEIDRAADPKGENAQGIFELQSDGRLKLDFAKGSGAPLLKEFSKDALVLSKATSPFVRSNKPPFPAATPYVAPVTPPDKKLVEEGNDLYHRKDYDGAIKLYTKAIELNPKNADAFFWRGNCFFDKNDQSASIADYEKALELDPTMKLKTLIDAMKQTQRVDGELSESPAPATPTATPVRSRKKAKP